MRKLSLLLVCFSVLFLGRANAERIHTHTEMGRQAARVVEISHELRDFVSPEDYAQILMPIIQQAGRTIAVAEANGDSSSTARPYCQRLVHLLDDANSLMMDLLAQPATELLATDMMTVTAELHRMMN